MNDNNALAASSGDVDLDEMLEDLVLRAAIQLGADIECSISVREDGRGRRMASSGPRAARCDEVECASGQGPCVQAMDTLMVVLVPDIGIDDRWPMWTRAAADAGFRSAAAFGVQIGDGSQIALNVYSDLLDPWDRDRIVRADVYAQQIAQVLDLALRLEKDGDRSELPRALAAQAEIERAVGAAMALHDCSARHALALLREESEHDGLSLSSVAARLLSELRIPADPIPADSP